MTMKDRSRRRAMTEEERALWEAFTQRLKPLRGKTRKPMPPRVEAAEPQSPSERRPAQEKRGASPSKPPLTPPPPQAPASKQPPLAAFEPRKARKLASGRIDIEARIDLHGMRQHEAHAELRRFILSCQAKGLRFVKVITGKGRETDGEERPFDLFDDRRRGVLKRLVPLWLAEPELRAIVVSFTEAGRGHGGEGALYVQLRRKGR